MNLKVEGAGILFVTEGLSVCHFSCVVPGIVRRFGRAHFLFAAIVPSLVTQLAPAGGTSWQENYGKIALQTVANC